MAADPPSPKSAAARSCNKHLLSYADGHVDSMASAAFTAVELIQLVLICASFVMFNCPGKGSSFILAENDARCAAASDNRICENAWKQ